MALHPFKLSTNSGADTNVMSTTPPAQPNAALHVWHKEFAGVVATWTNVGSGYADIYGAFGIWLPIPNDGDLSQWAVTNGEHPDTAAPATGQSVDPVISKLLGNNSSIFVEGTGTPYTRVDVHEAGTGVFLGSLPIRADGTFSGGIGNVRAGLINIVVRYTGDNGNTFSGWSNSMQTDAT
ncbi:hypothetical protein NUV89_01450 [Pseudomonas sp. 18.1.10]|uniref:hypothetical protein n=1 Tax=Pseudomonas sp. 18.1.10 TaxID=2969302 RepID=UPI00214FDB06|nr:hypothetical protein [Pseudomonas sp. 18.1.10]MCR4537057.1 hypothetical protein [Pseudomonas sp. 18.1.10]